MPERLEFDVQYDGRYTRARLLSEFGRGVVEAHWPGLYEPWPDDRSRNPYYVHAVNNRNGEEVAVYLSLAWELSAGLERWVLGAKETERILHEVPAEAMHPIAWDYRTEADETDWSKRGGTFVKALYPVDLADRAAWRGSPAALIRASERYDLVAPLTWGLGDVWAQVIVFATSRSEDMLTRLRVARPKPTLEGILAPGEVAIDVTIGADLGYYDSIDFVGHGDFRTRVEDTVKRARIRVAEYERGIPNIADMDGFLAALDRL